jgi:hypothetical protein
VLVPAGAFRGRRVAPHEMGDHFSVGRLGDTEIPLDKERPQPIAAKFRISGLDVGELRPAFIYLREILLDRCRMSLSHRKPPSLRHAAPRVSPETPDQFIASTKLRIAG